MLLYQIYTLEYNKERLNIYNFTMRFSAIFQASFPVWCSGEPSRREFRVKVCYWDFSHCYLCTGRTSPVFYYDSCGIFSSTDVCGCLGRQSLGSLKALFAFHHPDEHTSSEEREWNWAGVMNSLYVGVGTWGMQEQKIKFLLFLQLALKVCP